MSRNGKGADERRKGGFGFCAPERVIHVRIVRMLQHDVKPVAPDLFDLCELSDPAAEAPELLKLAIQLRFGAQKRCLKVHHGNRDGLTYRIAHTWLPGICESAIERPGIVRDCPECEKTVILIWAL